MVSSLTQQWLKTKAGEKHAFLKQHRETILDLIQLKGQDWVMAEFNLKESTFNNFVHGDGEPMYSYQRQHKTNEKWVNKEVLDGLFAEIEALKKRLETMEKQISRNDTRLELCEETYRSMAASQKQIGDNIQQFSQNTARVIAEGLLKPLIQQVTQPILDRLQPLSKPDLSVEHLALAIRNK